MAREGRGWALGRWGGERSWAGGERSGPRGDLGHARGLGQQEEKEWREEGDSAHEIKIGFPIFD